MKKYSVVITIISIYLISLQLVSCNNNKDKKISEGTSIESVFYPERIKISKDSIISPYIKSLINKDSIKFLEYDKQLFEEDSFVQERLVYIEYSENSETKKYLKNYDNILNRKLIAKSYNYVKEPINGSVVDNPYSEIYGIYLPVNRLNNEYILFEPRLYDKVIISDTAIFLYDFSDLNLNKYKNVRHVNDKYIIEFYNDEGYTKRIEIKTIDKTNHIQLWKIARNYENDSSSFYGLSVPIQYSFLLPVLNILNTGGLDDVYDKFDSIDYKELFDN